MVLNQRAHDGSLADQADPVSLADRRPRVYVHIFYGKDVETYRREYLAGREPDETPYGFHLAAQEGFDVSFSRDAPPSTGLVARLARRLPNIDLLHAFSNRERIRAADAVWTMTEGEAFAVAALMAFGIVPRRPVIGNAVWLLNNWGSYSGRRRKLYQYLSRTISVMTVHSRECLPVIRSALPRLRSELLFFGINTEMFRLTPPRIEEQTGPLRLFAIGNDRTRDWATLLAAFGNDPRFHLTIICWWLTDEDIARYDNVAVVRSPTMADFRRCYAETDMVVVPMEENIFSGITVALGGGGARQAGACQPHRWAAHVFRRR